MAASGKNKIKTQHRYFWKFSKLATENFSLYWSYLSRFKVVTKNHYWFLLQTKLIHRCLLQKSWIKSLERKYSAGRFCCEFMIDFNLNVIFVWFNQSKWIGIISKSYLISFSCFVIVKFSLLLFAFTRFKPFRWRVCNSRLLFRLYLFTWYLSMMLMRQFHVHFLRFYIVNLITCLTSLSIFLHSCVLFFGNQMCDILAACLLLMHL